MATYKIRTDVGDKLEDVSFDAENQVIINDMLININDGTSREDVVRALNRIADRLEGSIEDEPPAAFT